jgi:hypothetical protein
MIKIVGVVTECYVEDVSKQAGKRVPVSHLSVAVEQTDPPHAKAGLLGVERFRASLPSPFADLKVQPGARVEISTTTQGHRSEDASPLAILDLKVTGQP